jgi:hypothetical protein
MPSVDNNLYWGRKDANIMQFTSLTWLPKYPGKCWPKSIGMSAQAKLSFSEYLQYSTVQYSTVMQDK